MTVILQRRVVLNYFGSDRLFLEPQSVKREGLYYNTRLKYITKTSKALSLAMKDKKF